MDTVYNAAKWHAASLLHQAQRTTPLPIWDTVVGETERALIATALEFHCGNRVRAAQSLGITRNTLKQRMAYFGIVGP